MPDVHLSAQDPKAGMVDGSLSSAVFRFLMKLRADDTAAGLHIEPMKGKVLDDRVRTGRVDLNHRAVLFRVDHDRTRTYIYMGTWPHDEATAVARRATLRVNTVQGALEAVLTAAEPAVEIAEPSTASAVEAARSSHLGSFGYTMDDLTRQLGIDADLAAAALAASDEASVLDVAAAAPQRLQGYALLDLATGVNIAEIRETYSFSQSTVDETADPATQVVQALNSPANQAVFAYTEDDDELRRIIEGGSLLAWRTFLHPAQRIYVDGDYRGAFRLTGGAGTGKTIVAMHRARRLARTDDTCRVVLSTYNTTLADGLARDLTSLDPGLIRADTLGVRGVLVRGLDAVAWAVVSTASPDILRDATEQVLGHRTDQLSRNRTNTHTAWREAAAEDGFLPPALLTPDWLESEYVHVVLARGITSWEAYARVPRPGRGVRLSRTQRRAVWGIVETYRRASRLGDTLSYPEIVALAVVCLRLTDSPPADHVVIDEAQDLHPVHWQLLRALVAEGPNDLFIAEDAHQRIYGRPVPLSRFGINIRGRSRRLKLNYRTTRENLSLAMSVLDGAEYVTMDDGTEETTGYQSARTGPRPQLLACSSAREEFDKIAEVVRRWSADDASELPPESIAILARTGQQRDRLQQALDERGVAVRILDRGAPASGRPLAMTMHRAKGMEFARVVLAGVNRASVPSASALRHVPTEERADSELRERSLLYVAASRARDELVITWSGERSPLLR